jgi:subtilase family serine protease
MSETNNTRSDYVTVKLPDMTMSALSVPSESRAGSTITITDTTRNYGSAGAPATTTYFYLSTNGTLDAADVLLGSRPVPALIGGGTHMATTNLTIPPGTATRSYSIIAKADGAGSVAEANETNNTRYDSIGIDP